MRDWAKHRGGMRDTRNIENGIRDENVAVVSRDALIIFS